MANEVSHHMQEEMSSNCFDSGESTPLSPGEPSKSKKFIASTKKKQALSILYKHVSKKWNVLANQGFEHVQASWKAQDRFNKRPPFKMNIALTLEIFGLFFFPSLAKCWDAMTDRMRYVSEYANNFNQDYYRNLYHISRSRKGKVHVDRRLLDEM